MEFRFRAWNIESQRWNYFGITNVPKWVDESEVDQYTGIVDKNGTPIFWGDILETDLSFRYIVVVFRNGAFMYKCHDAGKTFYDFMFPSDKEEKTDHFLEVVGNVFENPELIERRD